MRAIVLQGEAGIGKTTVWHAALEAAARHGSRVVVTRPTEAEARLPFAGLNDLFGGLVDADSPPLSPPQRLALDVALMRVDVSGESMQPLALSLAVLELMRFASSAKPLVIAIDDVQWLDESTASVVRFALRRLENEPVVVLATARTGPATPPPPIVDGLPADRVSVVPVLPLGSAEVDRLMDESLDLQLSPTQRGRVHRMARGNPLHAIEIGRHLATSGGDTASDRAAVPDALDDLLRARVVALSAYARLVTAHAAALSYPTPAILGEVLGAERVQRGLAEARSADVLVAGDDPIRFSHPLLASEVYATLDESDRHEMHRRLASVVTEPEELARHLALAADGPDPAVAAVLDDAAVHAHARGASDAAGELSELAADLTPAPDPDRARRMASAGRYRLMAGDVASARELLERALAEPAAKRGPARAEVLYRLSGVRQLLDDFVAAESLGREALRHVDDDLPLTIRVKLLVAGISFITGRSWAAGARHAFEAMSMAEQLGDPSLEVAAIGAYATWRYATGHGYDPALADRADELEPWTAGLRTLDLPAFDIGNIQIAEGQTAAGFGRLRTLIDRAERDGDYSSLPFLLGNVTVGDLLDGRIDVAHERLDQASRLAEVTDQRTALVHTLAVRARVAARLGDAEAAHAAGRGALELMAVTSWRVGEWWMRSELALLELSRGDAAAAFELVAGALPPHEKDDSGRRRWAHGAAIEALVALGRLDEARSALTAIEKQARRHRAPRLRAEVLRARARVLAAGGEPGAADAAIAEAEAMHRQIEDRWELARTLLLAGEIHRRSRRRAKARAALREALEGFALMGSRLWTEQAREQLARISAARHDGGLTPTQRGIAELVASGLTNRQVADRMFMSAHTVEAHLSAIYRTLGITSRADLGAALAQGAGHPRDSAG